VSPYGCGVEEVEGLRERKKAATREALHRAAVRLASEHGFEHVTVEAIADEAGVSRRTFSNYFASKEEALFHGDARRARRLVDLVRAAPAGERPWVVLTRAAEVLVVEAGEDLAPDEGQRRQRLRSAPGLLAEAVGAYAAVERELAAELAGRLAGAEVELRSRVLAAAFLATVRTAVDHASGRSIDEMQAAVRQALAVVVATDGLALK
jgi:AcrR family transcriptional regulator